MRLDAAYDHIPRDSSASITTQGILGGKFVSVTGGSADVFLADRGRFLSTRSAIPLENLISRLVVRYLKQPAKAPPPGPRAD
jgi:phospholipid/cholesterol/gamma-HCH transport system substrate-binding protein